MSIARGEASTYTTFCETVHQVPVILISDLNMKDDKPRPFYINIDTIVAAKNEILLDCVANVYWKSGHPSFSSLLHGIMTVGMNTEGIVLSFSRTDVEIRPGDAVDPDYRQRHISYVPLQLRVFGKICRKSDGLMVIEVETYIPTGKNRFEVHFRMPETLLSQVPGVGGYAGGQGTLLSASSGAQASRYIEVDMHTLHVGVIGTPAIKNKSGRQEWIQAFKSSNASTSSRRTNAPSAPPVRPNVNSVTTFSEVYHRFMVVSILDPESSLLVVRTVATNGQAYDFELTWPHQDITLKHTVFSMIGSITTTDNRRVIVPVPGTVEVRPGHPSEVNYRHNHILSSPCRIRAAGKVVTSVRTEFTVIGFINVYESEVPFQVRFIVPVHEPRWRDFQGVTVGHFISARGRLSSLTDGTNATLHVDLEQLTNAPIAQVESSGSSGQSGHQMPSIVSTSAWDAPPTIPRPSTSAATSPGPSGAESAALVTIGEAATSGAGITSTPTASSTGNRTSGLLTPSPTPTSRTATTLASGSSLSSSPLYRNSPYAMGVGTTSSAARSNYSNMLSNNAQASDKAADLQAGSKRARNQADNGDDPVSKVPRI